MNIFDLLYEDFKFPKDYKIKMFSTFSGIGCERMAMNKLNANYEMVGISEIDKHAINSYMAIHGPTKNWGSITDVNGNELPQIDIFTYSFPCETKDSLILTNKGYVELQNLKVGDIVLTKSNTWQKVAKIFDNGLAQTYYVNAMGFENIHCTENHKFWIRRKYFKYNSKERKNYRLFTDPQFKELKNIDKNDYFGIPVIKEEKEFYTNDLDFWYMIGFYIGDGWLSKKGYDIKLACNEKKLEKLKSMLSCEKYKYSVTKDNTCLKFRFANKEIHNFINNYIGTGCENKKIPMEIVNLPKPQLQMFLQGYIDSDGYVQGKTTRISSINKKLLYSVSLIVNKLYNTSSRIYKGKRHGETIIQGRKVNTKFLYEIHFKKEKCKQDKSFYDNGYIWFPFKSIEKANIENVYNLEVENDHSYVLQGCISKNCTDLSKAGQQKGMTKETRSGLVYEVLRILKECEENNNLPKVLIMENVVDLIQSKYINQFNGIQKELTDLGYSNYVQTMNAKHYGIPQNRDRVFMVSILGEYNYSFKEPFDLKLRLSDLLQPIEEIEEKYYLSNKQIESISNWKAQQCPLENSKTRDDEIIQCITAKSNTSMNASMLLINEATKKGYTEAYEGDSINLDQLKSETRRGRVGEQISNTLTTSCNIGVCVLSGHEIYEKLTIRKLSTIETWRLMGISDEDFYKAEKVCSSTQLFKQAGNGIVVDVFAYILENLIEKG